jgi:predicted transcriptional regulator/DNA-binding XRE family transcriptional regulator
MHMVGMFDERKLFAGARVRRLRIDNRLTQTDMAERIGVSNSYLNLIERNQRPLTANVLLRLASAFDVDLRSLMEPEKRVTEEGLAEIFGDPALAGVSVSRGEVQDLIANAPNAAQALEILFGLYREHLRSRETGMELPAEAGHELAVERVRDVLAERRNHFPDLEALGERLHDEVDARPGQLLPGLADRLQSRHRIRVRIVPGAVMGALLRSFDAHRRVLNLSDLAEQSSRLFQVAFQLAVVEGDAAIQPILASAGLRDERSRHILKLALLNYLAAALMMPYGRFFKVAEELAYDIELIGQRFDASFEQVCHRLTTLQRAKQRGVSFFMIRVDPAGTVSKRLSSGGFPFSRYGGTCPLWNVHKAFDQPGRIHTQVLELPDGERFFSIARTVRRAVSPWGLPEGVFAVALACDLKSAERVVYSRGLDLRNPGTTPIGVNCRLCPRGECPQRAAPALGREPRDSEFVKTISPFGFSEPPGALPG